MNRKILVLSGLLVILLTSLYITYLFQTVPELLSYPSEPNTPQNKTPKSTLGFERIYVINLVHRLDRRYKMEALANALDLEFDFFPAASVNDNDILNQYNFSISLSHKACYVSHYRAYESIVSNGYSSALILEDDIDIESSIISIMQDIHHILPTDWETLYVGHCSWERGGMLVGQAHNFDLYRSSYPVCTHAYAVTLAGAEKLLKELTEPSMPIDLELAVRVKAGEITSYSLEPSAIVQWKSKDNPSDVSPGADQWTYPLVNSTLHALGFKEI